MGGQAAIQHILIAEWTGLPVQFIKWKYPTLESLLRVADLNAENRSLSSVSRATIESLVHKLNATFIFGQN